MFTGTVTRLFEFGPDPNGSGSVPGGLFDPPGPLELNLETSLGSPVIVVAQASERPRFDAKGLRFAHGSGARFGEELCSVIVRGVKKANAEK